MPEACLEALGLSQQIVHILHEESLPLSLSLSLSLRIVHVLNMLSSKNVQNWGSRVKKFWDLFLCGNPFGLGEAGEAPKYSVPICVLRIECLPFDAFMHTSCGCHRRVHACACVCVCVYVCVTAMYMWMHSYLRTHCSGGFTDVRHADWPEGWAAQSKNPQN